jgi:hypothetical protein
MDIEPRSHDGGEEQRRLRVPSVYPGTDIEWVDVPETGTTKWCKDMRQFGRERATNRVTSWPRPCDSCDCQKCAPGRIELALAHAAHVFEPHERIWYTACKLDDKVRGRVKHRLSDVPHEYLTVVNNGILHIFSTHDLAPPGTRSEPSSGIWYTSQVALYVLAGVALKLPGVRRLPSYSKGWRLSACAHGCTLDRTSTGRFLVYGRATRTKIEGVFETAAAVMEMRYGAHPEFGQELPDGIPPDEFDAAIKDELDRSTDE